MKTQPCIYDEGPLEISQEPRPTLASIPFVETDFAESEDGSLIEMIEDPENSSKSLLAVWKDGVVRITDRFCCRDRILVPIPRDQHIVKHVRFPQGVESCVSVEAALAQIKSIFLECLDLSEPQAQGLDRPRASIVSSPTLSAGSCGSSVHLTLSLIDSA